MHLNNTTNKIIKSLPNDEELQLLMVLLVVNLYSVKYKTLIYTYKTKEIYIRF